MLLLDLTIRQRPPMPRENFCQETKAWFNKPLSLSYLNPSWLYNMLQVFFFSLFPRNNQSWGVSYLMEQGHWIIENIGTSTCPEVTRRRKIRICVNSYNARVQENTVNFYRVTLWCSLLRECRRTSPLFPWYLSFFHV